jgi:copper ion binding protein
LNTAATSGNAMTDLSFLVQGMTCASCVSRVEKALKAVPGVVSASVNLATEKANIQGDSNLRIDALSAAVKKAGYEVPAEVISLSISGMTCASCGSRVEKALKKVPGVMEATVNLATEKAQVQSLGVPLESLLAAVRKAGYEAAPASDLSAGATASASGMPTWWPVAAAAALSLPLAVPMLGLPFGVHWMLPGAASGACCPLHRSRRGTGHGSWVMVSRSGRGLQTTVPIYADAKQITKASWVISPTTTTKSWLPSSFTRGDRPYGITSVLDHRGDHSPVQCGGDAHQVAL